MRVVALWLLVCAVSLLCEANQEALLPAGHDDQLAPAHVSVRRPTPGAFTGHASSRRDGAAKGMAELRARVQQLEAEAAAQAAQHKAEAERHKAANDNLKSKLKVLHKLAGKGGLLGEAGGAAGEHAADMSQLPRLLKNCRSDFARLVGRVSRGRNNARGSNTAHGGSFAAAVNKGRSSSPARVSKAARRKGSAPPLTLRQKTPLPEYKCEGKLDHRWCEKRDFHRNIGVGIYMERIHGMDRYDTTRNLLPQGGCLDKKCQRDRRQRAKKHLRKPSNPFHICDADCRKRLKTLWKKAQPGQDLSWVGKLSTRSTVPSGQCIPNYSSLGPHQKDKRGHVWFQREALSALTCRGGCCEKRCGACKCTCVDGAYRQIFKTAQGRLGYYLAMHKLIREISQVSQTMCHWVPLQGQPWYGTGWDGTNKDFRALYGKKGQRNPFSYHTCREERRLKETVSLWRRRRRRSSKRRRRSWFSRAKKMASAAGKTIKKGVKRVSSTVKKAATGLIKGMKGRIINKVIKKVVKLIDRLIRKKWQVRIPCNLTGKLKTVLKWLLSGNTKQALKVFTDYRTLQMLVPWLIVNIVRKAAKIPGVQIQEMYQEVCQFWRSLYMDSKGKKSVTGLAATKSEIALESWSHKFSDTFTFYVVRGAINDFFWARKGGMTAGLECVNPRTPCEANNLRCDEKFTTRKTHTWECGIRFGTSFKSGKRGLCKILGKLKTSAPWEMKWNKNVCHGWDYAPSCAARVQLKLFSCNTCCCKGGLTGSDVKLSLTYPVGAHANQDCGTWFGFVDATIRTSVSFARALMGVYAYAFKCYGAKLYNPLDSHFYNGNKNGWKPCS